MPRIPRKNNFTNISHVMVQGINKEYIFEDDKLKMIYFNLLKEYLNEKILILAYCIMDNHTHILIYSESSNDLSAYMKKINCCYAMLYNKLKDRVGYVFRNRFKMQPILDIKQLKNCLIYIHNNPVKAGIVKKLEEYKYSSFNEFYGEKTLLTSKGVEIVFGKKIMNKQQLYQIHKINIDNDEFDDVDSKIDVNGIINDFIQKSQISIEKITSDYSLFSILLKELNTKGKCSLRKLANMFNINKDKISKIMKEF